VLLHEKKQKFRKLLHFLAEQLQFVVDFEAGHLHSSTFSQLDSNLLIYFIALIHDWEPLFGAMSKRNSHSKQELL